jgi:hypothetical protein
VYKASLDKEQITIQNNSLKQFDKNNFKELDKREYYFVI